MIKRNPLRRIEDCPEFDKVKIVRPWELEAHLNNGWELSHSLTYKVLGIEVTRFLVGKDEPPPNVDSFEDLPELRFPVDKGQETLEFLSNSKMLDAELGFRILMALLRSLSESYDSDTEEDKRIRKLAFDLCEPVAKFLG